MLPTAQGEDTRVKHQHLEPYKWKPGVSPNPAGRPKGARSKLGEAFVQAMHDDFQAHGANVIEKVRIEKPDQYLKVIASILPKELTVNTNALGEMSDDELAGTLAAIRDLAASLDVAIAGAGAAQESVAQPAPQLRAVS